MKTKKQVKSRPKHAVTRSELRGKFDKGKRGAKKKDITKTESKHYDQKNHSVVKVPEKSRGRYIPSRKAPKPERGVRGGKKDESEGGGGTERMEWASLRKKKKDKKNRREQPTLSGPG